MKHLSDELPDGFEASLVKAGQGGEPPAGRRARALDAALGVLALTSVAPLAATAGATLTTTAKPTASAALALLPAGWKIWTVCAVLGATIVAGAGVMIWQRTAHTREPAVSQLTQPPRVAAEVVPPASPPVDVPVLPREIATATVAPPTRGASTTAPAHSDLTAELATIDRARAALDARRPDDAMRALDGYERQHPHASLAREAELLRIEALVMRGDRREAQQRARVLSADPLYQARLHLILGDDLGR